MTPFLFFPQHRPHTPSECARLAGYRAPEVMMGVDLFVAPGRAGEGFDCTRPLRLALEAGVSAALFAPAWVYETKQAPSFEGANDSLWAGVKAVRQDLHLSPPHWPTLFSLPLYSNFSQVSGTPFLSLSLQTLPHTRLFITPPRVWAMKCG